MKICVLALVSGFFISGPLAAQTAPQGEEVEEGFSLMEEGAKLLLKGLMAEMEPTLDDMAKALADLEPALRELQPKMLELLALVDDLKNYEAPERLGNGDILIRRKPDAPAPPPLPERAPDPAPQTAPQTDL